MQNLLCRSSNRDHVPFPSLPSLPVGIPNKGKGKGKGQVHGFRSQEEILLPAEDC